MADATELPRERLLAHGPQALTDAELLQLVVRAEINIIRLSRS